ncbi:MAG: hypothetical protein F6K54_29060 [Okeania sp. SIO3B5]|uniref:hypothetical protein n=1 Tax=Okeania sp. SIO3B5 TaxID=2607811 RepID=UPI0013FE8418|nr:hypothetical protein [Okeania sp. SIO3B5]NEO56768.1 hypothetical protein [Okeania sp. SIO3B5]
MNKSYEGWENQFLDQMVKELHLYGNNAIAFKERLLSGNELKYSKQLRNKLKDDYEFSESTLKDCWNKTIYPALIEHGFNCKDKNNTNGKYQKTRQGVRKWLETEIFPEYIKNIAPKKTTELWQELLNQAENNSDVSLEIVRQK